MLITNSIDTNKEKNRTKKQYNKLPFNLQQHVIYDGIHKTF